MEFHKSRQFFCFLEMDSVEERKKRIEELKRKKAALLSQGKTAESAKPT